MAVRKIKNLVIVESPTKAKTINKYLGPDFEVVASKGHVRDLPKSRFGIDIEAGWIPKYLPLKEKGKTELLASLKKQAAKADMVYLAPDPDREGEAIAWHLKEFLGLADDKVMRVRFNEITKNAVKKAFDEAGAIDMDRVAAQEARRFLDRVVGYKISPLLSRKLAETLSAGRVQSVALRLIVEREREIEAFKPEEFWRISALLSATGAFKLPYVTKKKPAAKKFGAKTAVPQESNAIEVPDGAFLAELAEWNGEKFKADNGDLARTISDALKNAAYHVSKVEQKDRAEKPQAPFTTSTMQQQANIRLRFSAQRTMSRAQDLYQGVSLGEEGQVALITYMRTDSTRIGNEALASVREHIEKVHGKPYLPEKANFYASGKSAQEAHEAIRPTDLSYTPEHVEKFLKRGKDWQDQLKLYTLIYNRFVASQMMPAIFAVTNVEVSAAKGLFKAQGKILKFDGYRKVMAPAGKSEDTLLPALTEKQLLDLLNLNSTQHFTEPPPRYNEASLVKTLEKEGIGRPSTYAAIISKIQEREYVELRERRFFATAIGMKVTDLLVANFPKVMDLKFTSLMEEELDQIETRKFARNTVLNDFYIPFEESLKLAEIALGLDAEKCPLCQKPLVERFSRFGKFFGCSGHPECKYIKKKGPGEQAEKVAPEPTDFICPTCGKNMLKRMGRRGPFLGCSGYPDCKTTMNFNAEGQPVLASKPTEHICDKCKKPMVLREGPRGQFLACTGYPKCKNACDVDAKGNPVKPIEAGINCEKCGSPMIVKRGPRGPFIGCSAYPKCRSTKPVPEEMKEKLKDLLPPPKKAALPKVEVSETCPECGEAMELRKGRKGFFLGCTQYGKTKCKGTVEMTPELLEQVNGQKPAE